MLLLSLIKFAFRHSYQRLLAARLLTGLATLALVSPAQAFEPLSYSWNGSVSRTWNTPANWTPNGVPAATDHVTIGPATNAPLLAANASLTNFTLSGGSPDLGGFTLTITGTAAFQSGAVSNGALVCSGPTTHFGDPASAAQGPTLSTTLSVTSAVVTLSYTTFNASTTLTKTGDGNESARGGNVFNAPAWLTNAGAGRWILQESTADRFQADLTLSNTGGGSIYPVHGGSNTQFNGNLIVNSTNGSGIVFSGNNGTCQLAEGKTLSVGSLGYSAGALCLYGLTQLGNTPQSLTLTGGAILRVGNTYGVRSQFYGPVHFRAPGLFLNGAIYHSTATLEKTGDSDDHGYGGNQFEGAATLINSSVNDFFFGGNNSANNTDVFQASVTFSNRGSGLLWLGYGGSRQFNGPVVVNSTAGQGIRMSGTSQLAQGQTLSVGSEGFLAGNLEINHLTQLGSTAQQLGLSGGAGLRLSGCTFGGSVDLIAPALWLDTNTFQGEARLTRSGSMYSDSRGGNTFQGKLTFRNLGGSGYNLATDTDNTIR